ncbi:nuclear transport factor 2 family protein [Stenotrophomonas sp. ESTM1D_MKCIP4_1]|uniref:nuclear transport factor 2 family protein n=1 Tax=Stenotrophomonas sp. ESTM1D_MKCIP4_1 TaxID=2072414 RepID=UPI0020B125D0|nr:nuclear transport factor 2 family protein [Stenotrophomonas sp. ESTM1D_MKCIP4_1]
MPVSMALMQRVAETLAAATNAFDVDGAVSLFTPDAVIDDPSTGQRFDGAAGVRAYIERYFVGYHTVTRILSVEPEARARACVRVDFKGDFGHETGRLVMALDAAGRIRRIDADLD